MSEIFIVQGSACYLPTLIEESISPPENGEMLWTCPRTVRAGDVMLIYLLAPVSAIVARAEFSGDAFVMDDFDSDWFGKPMASYERVRMFAEPIALHELRLIFPEWHWTHRPQGSVKVPENEKLQLKRPFAELIAGRSLRPQEIAIVDGDGRQPQ